MLGEAADGGLAGGVGGGVGQGDEALDAADVDDAALCRLQLGQEAGDHVEDAVEVHCERGIPVFPRGGVFHLAAADDAGIVHQRVDRAQFPLDPLGEGIDIGAVGDVELEGCCVRTDFRGGAHGGFAVHIGGDDEGAGAGHGERDALADA